MEQIREMLVAALCAARYGKPPPPAIAQAVLAGDRGLTLDRLEFDSFRGIADPLVEFGGVADH
jgi:hypothetical protein